MKRKLQLHDIYGFTIVELLVTLAIIGMLLAVVLASFSAAKAKGRDVERESEIQLLAVALRIFAEKHGRYPSSADGVCSHYNSFSESGCMQVLVSEGFIDELPADPLNETYSGTWQNDQMYFYDNWCRSPGPAVNNKQYRLWANGERNNHQGTAKNWWFDNTIGATTCSDPS